MTLPTYSPNSTRPITYLRKSRGNVVNLLTLTATSSRTATLPRSPRVTRSATSTRTATLPRQPRPTRTATLSEVASLTRRTNKLLLLAKGLLARLTIRRPLTLVATKSLNASLTRSVRKTLTATLNKLATLTRASARGLVLLATKGTSVTLRKAVSFHLSATAGLVATLTALRRLLRTLSATLHLGPSVRTSSSVLRTATVHGGPTLTRSIRATRRAVVTLVATLATSLVRTLTLLATESATATLTRRVGKLLVRQLATVVSLRRVITFGLIAHNHQDANNDAVSGQKIWLNSTLTLVGSLQKDVKNVRRTAITLVTASLTKRVAHRVQALFSTASTVNEKVSKHLASVSVKVPVLTRSVRITVSGAIAHLVATLTRSTAYRRTYAATATLQSSVLKRIGATRAAIQSLHATLRVTIEITRSVTLSFFATFTRAGAITLLIQAQVGVIGRLIRKTQTTLRASDAPQAAMTKRAQLTEVAVRTTLARLTRQVGKVSAAIEHASATLTQRPNKHLLALLQTLTQLTKRVSKTLQRTVALTPRLTKELLRTFTTSTHPVATVTMRFVQLLTLVATLSLVPSVRKRVGKPLEPEQDFITFARISVHWTRTLARPVLARLTKRIALTRRAVATTVATVTPAYFVNLLLTTVAVHLSPRLSKRVNWSRRARVWRTVTLQRRVARTTRALWTTVAHVAKRQPLRLVVVVTTNVNLTRTITKVYQITVSAVQHMVAALTPLYVPFNRTWGYVMKLVTRAAYAAGLRNYED